MNRLLAFGLVTLVLAGCAASGIANDPLTRNFQWSDIMAGSDIRRGCGPGAPERWRFVYNGVYEEQVRVYEIDGNGVEARVFDRMSLASLDTYRTDQLMRGVNARAEVTPEDLRGLVRAWESDLPKAARPGDHLRSDRFFWTTAACHNGRFIVAGFNYPSDGTSTLSFPEQLARFDRTGKPVNPPRAFERDVLVLTDYRVNRQTGDTSIKFLLKVTPDGIQPGY